MKRFWATEASSACSCRYKVQPSPDGLAQAFIAGRSSSSGTSACAMVLGDNIFYGNGFSGMLRKAVKNAEETAALRCLAIM